MTDWLDDALIRGPMYCLCTKPKQFKRILREMEMPKADWPVFIVQGYEATTHTMESTTERTACIVCIRRNDDDNQVKALLAHEAMHIWREARLMLREDDPSAEFEAYSVQRICHELFTAYGEGK